MPEDVNHIAEILAGPDYFDCARLACRLLRRVCLNRQKEAFSFHEYAAGARSGGIGKKIVYAMCSDCAQGLKILEETKMAPRSCEQCGRTIHSGSLCGACKKMRAAVTPIRRIEVEMIPTGERKGEKMGSRRGKCVNCGREGLVLADAAGHCHSCYSAFKEPDGPERERALEECRRKMNDPANSRAKAQGSATAPAETKDEPKPMPTRAHHEGPNAAPQDGAGAAIGKGRDPSPISITLRIESEQDRKVHDYLHCLARDHRRTVEQEILWICEVHMTAHDRRWRPRLRELSS